MDAVNLAAMIFKICIFFTLTRCFSISFRQQNDKLHAVRKNDGFSIFFLSPGDETPIDDSLYDYVKRQTIFVMIY